ncbi:PGPGW domain-containing protein [Arthrobacter agilis]|uniref:PGPGW domain-containing protein n=1 Tax=Arthrobacter agilis TaxID=37921 RepID=UPI00236501DC|nr:PGPGW domain-containing protein [Arthrobacter agilis]WDF33427.1 PGPGW domain-containing protein [Arthrobacter agilis]
MAARERVPGWVRRTVIEVFGWTLVVVGVAALVLPGPGLLMIAAGLALLSQQYHWARRYLRPLKANAYHAAALGVKTIPRILASCASALVIMSLGVLWIVKPAVPAWWFLDDKWWLFGGTGTGISLVVSSVIALVLIVYSVHRFRGRPIPARPATLWSDAD